jgi:hypothetical protein
MSGYMFVVGPCFGCKRLFTFNADHVPSIPINGVREPICQTCVDEVNPGRVARGLEPIVPHPNAYEPGEVT